MMGGTASSSCGGGRAVTAVQNVAAATGYRRQGAGSVRTCRRRQRNRSADLDGGIRRHGRGRAQLRLVGISEN